MTFLAPLAGLIAAAVTVPTLLIFYFLKLRRKQVRVSSTILWWHAVQDLQVNTPFRWLRVSLLLILQLLALACLLLAVARPAIREEGGGGSRVVLVIDRSASMSATDGAKAEGQPPPSPLASVTRLAEAKRRALETVAKLARRSGGWGFSLGGSPAWRACVVTFAAHAEARTAFTSDEASLREAIEGVTPTDQPADLAALLRFVDALSGATGDEAAPTERTKVYLFSDGSFGETASAPTPPRGVDAELVRVGPAAVEGQGHGNLGIVSVSARRDYDDPGVVRVFVRVVNAGAEAVETVLQLRVDGALVDAKTLSVPGPTAQAVAAVPVAPGEPDSALTPSAPALQPGESSVTFEVQNTEGGVAVATLTRADLLSADDSAGLVLAPAGRARVLLVAPGEMGKDADTYLSGVLEAMDLRALRRIGEREYEEMMRWSKVPLGTSGLPAGSTTIPDVRDWDVVVFDRVRPAELPTLASISFGAALPMPGMAIARVGKEGEPSAAERFVSWRRTHPVLRYANLDQVLIAPAVVLTLPTEVPGGKGEAIAWGEHGALMAVLEAGGGSLRRVVVAFEIGGSNWGPDFSFPVFLSNAVEYLALRGEASAGRFVRTTDAVQVRAGPNVREVVLEGPEKLTAPVRALAESAAGEAPTVTFGQLEHVGVYRVTGGAAGSDRLAVNLCDTTETLLRTADRLVIGGRERSVDAKEEEGPREVWHWFVALAFVLLVVEWFVQVWRMRA